MHFARAHTNQYALSFARFNAHKPWAARFKPWAASFNAQPQTPSDLACTPTPLHTPLHTPLQALHPYSPTALHPYTHPYTLQPYSPTPLHPYTPTALHPDATKPLPSVIYHRHAPVI